MSAADPAVPRAQRWAVLAVTLTLPSLGDTGPAFTPRGRSDQHGRAPMDETVATPPATARTQEPHWPVLRGVSTWGVSPGGAPSRGSEKGLPWGWGAAGDSSLCRSVKACVTLYTAGVDARACDRPGGDSCSRAPPRDAADSPGTSAQHGGRCTCLRPTQEQPLFMPRKSPFFYLNVSPAAF